MANEPITIYKLIILYTLSRVETTLPQDILYDYIIKQGYTNYFNAQNALSELLQADLVWEDATYHLAYYGLTKAGEDTLALFGNQLSPDIRGEIDEYLKENRMEILNETSLVSDYERTPQGTYLSSCTLREGNHVLFQLALEAATEEDARKICENWRESSEELYRMAVTRLLRGKQA
ncbi:MAG: DUF4364 family protein [Lachnospiraceae bacterium]|nr:DUF4364 family protein [Lachnospiraceae bacterium]